MEMSITDYWTIGSLTAQKGAQCITPQAYAERLGFRVVRDHDRTQRGSECGIIAAKVLVHLKQAGAGFMDSVATHATRYASFKYDGDATLEAGTWHSTALGTFLKRRRRLCVCKD